MRIDFWKMHGAGNDFILVDDRGQTFPAQDEKWLAAVAARRTGVGADGIILLRPSRDADFAMCFFNPDGREAEMCGNGARCVARLAHDLHIAPAQMRIETRAGVIEADIVGSQVRIRMPNPCDWRRGRVLEWNGQHVRYDFVNTGVPHVVLEVTDLPHHDVRAWGAGIRHHPEFQPDGTNVNFIAVAGPHDLRVRTYERGVEGETLACGTGITACALVAARRGHVCPPVDVTTRRGDRLTVDFILTSAGAERVTLLGPAVYVFRGSVCYEPERSPDSPAPCNVGS